MGAIQFIENMDRSSLTISDDEFERNVEAAVSAIAEKHQANSPVVTHQSTFNEKTGLHYGESSTRPSTDGADGSTPRRSTSSYEGEPDDRAAISGLLRTFQKPLTTIGRIFSDETGSSSSGPGSAPRSPAPPGADRNSPRHTYVDEQRPQRPNLPRQPSRHELPAEEAAARQASAEAAEAQKLSRAEHANVVETLAGMFPDLDKEVISDVVHQKQGRLVSIRSADCCYCLLRSSIQSHPISAISHHIRSPSNHILSGPAVDKKKTIKNANLCAGLDWLSMHAWRYLHRRDGRMDCIEVRFANRPATLCFFFSLQREYIPYL